MQVVDLGSAPGGWLQVAAQKVLHTRQLGAGVCERVEAAGVWSSSDGAVGPDGNDSDDAVSFLSLMGGGGEDAGGRDAGAQSGQSGGDGGGVGQGRSQRHQVVGVDLLPVAPVPGTLALQGDFTREHVQARLLSRMRRPKADAGTSRALPVPVCVT